jgi:cytochrome b6-f complex iron-sulfur subunit
MDQQCDESRNKVSRRFVNLFLGLGFVSTLSGFAGTALAYLLPGKGMGAASNFIAGRDGVIHSDAIGEDQGVVGRSRLGKILVIRKGAELVGLQATCTHLGCTVAWDSAAQQVACPCHGARYDIQGQVLRGPAREPLAQIELVASAQGVQLASPTT